MQTVGGETEGTNSSYFQGPFFPMIGENRQLVTDEPVEFEK